MKTSTIQRPQLFTQFFDKELIWNNEYLTYIKTSIHKATIKVTSTLHNFSIKTISQLKQELDNLTKQSKNLFKKLPSSRKEFDEVNQKISKLLRPSIKKSTRASRNYMHSRVSNTRIKHCIKRIKGHPPITDEDCKAF